MQKETLLLGVLLWATLPRTRSLIREEQHEALRVCHSFGWLASVVAWRSNQSVPVQEPRTPRLWSTQTPELWGTLVVVRWFPWDFAGI